MYLVREIVAAVDVRLGRWNPHGRRRRSLGLRGHGGAGHHCHGVLDVVSGRGQHVHREIGVSCLGVCS